MSHQVQAIDILLVEDNPGDVRLTQEALKEAKVANRLHLARDGVEAVDFLRRSGELDGRPRPDLVLLDLNLPRMSGREVVKRVADNRVILDLKLMAVAEDENTSRLRRLRRRGGDRGVSCRTRSQGRFRRVVRGTAIARTFGG